jgi:PHD/YefM family antitoxin component YafN of YafNO toxin-antitoxin module
MLIISGELWNLLEIQLEIYLLRNDLNKHRQTF